MWLHPLVMCIDRSRRRSKNRISPHGAKCESARMRHCMWFCQGCPANPRSGSHSKMQHDTTWISIVSFASMILPPLPPVTACNLETRMTAMRPSRSHAAVEPQQFQRYHRRFTSVVTQHDTDTAGLSTRPLQAPSPLERELDMSAMPPP